MLKIYDELPNSAAVIHDVEEAFTNIELQEDTCTKNIMKYVDCADYVDNIRFKDRFGNLLYLDDLSSGCKAALCVHYLQNNIIDLLECGLNARDAIIAYCDSGNVILHDWCVSLADIPDLGTTKCIEYNSIVYSPEEFDREVLC